jgi:hypothetical protein
MLVDYQEHGSSRAHEAGLDFSLRHPDSSTGTLIDISFFSSFFFTRPSSCFSSFSTQSCHYDRSCEKTKPRDGFLELMDVDVLLFWADQISLDLMH